MNGPKHLLRREGCWSPAGSFSLRISHDLHRLVTVSRKERFDPAFAAIVERDLTDGIHRNPTDRLEWFTTAHFHRPEEIAPEIEAAGLRFDRVLAVEGPGWMNQQLDGAGRRERLEAIARPPVDWERSRAHRRERTLDRNRPPVRSRPGPAKAGHYARMDVDNLQPRL